ncbi:hypothetical protein [Vibrio vulnificus]|uniref:hypothetical protein n=1 Tax=Vibrio vulnificus TaxID=672 RepID=UPI00069178F5|nr:hypothetical protein [Vibrio vulnificus]EIE1227696.1 hypothetical protein [Vibrio vulnificus]EJS4046038.1 hypothetical protein [Vibrio vulnificus]ELA3117467.1 hypothetical protein [Vibrio vulnificus]HDY8127557.1 hypothetical protein [Vibrio vulnificus]HDZ3276335.1 hypothetical protein [Vibrio vulnificus]
MKKVSLLAASVAIALTGCGGSDSGSGSNGNVAPGGVIVTGFDGYFNQAVVFDDINNNGQLDLDSDNVFGLTNQKGQITLAKDTEIKGSLALKTLRPGDVEKELAVKLAALSPENDTYSDFMNTYTTDMDHEGQPMANSVVFRAPIAGEKADSNMVISPITDLVAIEMGKNANLSIEEASANVSTLLGATDEQPINPFSDFVKDAKTNLASAQLHKTAQILTESKAKNPTEYTKNATAIASTAKDEAKEIVTESNIGTDEVLNTTPVINPSKPEVAVTNYKLLVNAAAKAELTHTFAALDIQEGVVATHTITLPENLFIDRFEGRETPVAASDATINGKGIILTLNNGVITLTTEAALLTQDKFTVTVTADDRATANGEVLNKLSETFSFTVELSNTAPEVDGDVQTSLQTHIDSWKLAQGVEFKNELDMSGLFTDREGDELTITTNINTVIPGLTSTFDKATGKLTISGRPASAHPAQRFTVIANDGHVATRIESHPASFDLPAVTQGEIKTNATVLAELKAEANTWTLQVGQAFENTLDISKLFEDSISGDVEYYAHYAAHDNIPAKNPIPGVKVSVDASGLVSLTGTPTAETNGVILYVAKGINFSGGEENDVESEMVEILLPNVQPSDVTPEPEAHPLEGKTWYMLEHGSDDGNDYDEYDYSRVWCDSIKFEDGIVYGNVRNEANRTTCGEATTQTENATYKVENGQLIATFHFEEGGIPQIESFAVEMAGDANEISQGAKTIVHRSVSSNVSEAERYTYYSSKADAEARIQVRSDDVADKRFGYIYLPAEQNNTYNLGMVSFALVENSQGYNAYLNFDVEGKDFSCATVNEFYKSFKLTGNDLATSFGQHEISGSCNTITDEEFTYASIYFNLSEIQDLAVDNIYSFIGKTVDTNGEYAEAVKFNIKWTGTGNNE